MPNKPVIHTELDNAIKNSLSNLKSEAKVDWNEIEKILPKKSSAVKVPLSDFRFSLNSFSGLIATGSFLNFKSTLLFFKKWAVASYAIAGSVTVIIGSYLIYNSLNKNTSEKTKSTTVIVPVGQNSVEEQKQPSASNGNADKGSSVIKEVEEPRNSNDMPVISTPGSALSETQNSANNSLTKSSLKSEKIINSDEPVILKTEDTSSSETFNSSKTDSDSEQTDGKRSKVIYYKESLSLDKLEQQMSGKKDEIKNEPSITPENNNGSDIDTSKKGALFNKQMKHSDKKQ